jgi:hypothetical protein
MAGGKKPQFWRGGVVSLHRAAGGLASHFPPKLIIQESECKQEATVPFMT